MNLPIFYQISNLFHRAFLASRPSFALALDLTLALTDFTLDVLTSLTDLLLSFTYPHYFTMVTEMRLEPNGGFRFRTDRVTTSLFLRTATRTRALDFLAAVILLTISHHCTFISAGGIDFF